MCSVQERNVSSLSISGNVLTIQTAPGNFLILCQIVSHPNINFLVSKLNKASKIDPKMLKQKAAIDMFCLLHKEAKLYSQINR